MKNFDQIREGKANEGELNELTAAEKKLVDKMYDKKGNLTPFGKKVMSHKFPTNTSATQGKRMGEEVDEKTSSTDLAKAMAAFRAKGGKVKKVAPGRAQGAHGKDDLGTDMHGILDRGDTRKFKTKKGGKVKSMGAR